MKLILRGWNSPRAVKRCLVDRANRPKRAVLGSKSYHNPISRDRPPLDLRPHPAYFSYPIASDLDFHSVTAALFNQKPSLEIRFPVAGDRVGSSLSTLESWLA